MSSAFHDHDLLAKTEQLLSDAKDFVRPSDDLRPRTLELARQTSRTSRLANRSTVCCLGLMILWSVGWTLLRFAGQFRESVAGPSSQEIHEAADRYTQQYHYESDWGLVDAFSEVRQFESQSYSTRSTIRVAE